ncbi:MAG: hypothetical protein OEM46_06100 [Ignavibacteria bacterium]|nr:hypothetical protein [Ignavibacteria bacterium]
MNKKFSSFTNEYYLNINIKIIAKAKIVFAISNFISIVVFMFAILRKKCPAFSGANFK